MWSKTTKSNGRSFSTEVNNLYSTRNVDTETGISKIKILKVFKNLKMIVI